MARRFGGPNSPGAPPGAAATSQDPWAGRRRARAGGRVNALFVAPLPLLPFAFLNEPAGLALNLIAFGLLIGAAWMTREGVIAHQEYDLRKVARRPALPRKILGSLLTGLGLAVAGANSGQWSAPVIFAVLGAGLHFLSFGADPLSDKGADGVDRFQADRVARVVDEAEKHLAAMRAAIEPASERALVTRVERFIDTARDMCRTVEEDPRDLTAARKYLGVYLLGARDATVKFADLYARDRDAGVRAEYVSLLDDLEQGFAQRRERLLADNRSDLDIEIEVLRNRLAREGRVEGRVQGPAQGRAEGLASERPTE